MKRGGGRLIGMHAIEHVFFKTIFPSVRSHILLRKVNRDPLSMLTIHTNRTCSASSFENKLGSFTVWKLKNNKIMGKRTMAKCF